MKEFFRNNRSSISFCLGLICFTMAVKLTPKSLSVAVSMSSMSNDDKSFLIFFVIGLIGGLLGLFAIKGNLFKKSAFSQPIEQKAASKASIWGILACA